MDKPLHSTVARIWSAGRGVATALTQGERGMHIAGLAADWNREIISLDIGPLCTEFILARVEGFLAGLRYLVGGMYAVVGHTCDEDSKSVALAPGMWEVHLCLLQPSITCVSLARWPSSGGPRGTQRRHWPHQSVCHDVSENWPSGWG